MGLATLRGSARHDLLAPAAVSAETLRWGSARLLGGLLLRAAATARAAVLAAGRSLSPLRVVSLVAARSGAGVWQRAGRRGALAAMSGCAQARLGCGGSRGAGSCAGGPASAATIRGAKLAGCGAGLACLASGLAGGAGVYVLVARGAVTIDLGIGRAVRPLRTIRLEIAAPAETVFDVVAAPYLRRTPRAMAGKLEVWERGSDMAVAAHFTPVSRGMRTTTVEAVRFTRPERIEFRLLRGPVPHVRETFELHPTASGTQLEYTGEMGTDLWALGRWWGRAVAGRWEATVRSRWMGSARRRSGGPAVAGERAGGSTDFERQRAADLPSAPARRGRHAGGLRGDRNGRPAGGSRPVERGARRARSGNSSSSGCCSGGSAPRSVRRALASSRPVGVGQVGTGEPTPLWQLPVIVAGLTGLAGGLAGWDAGVRVTGGCLLVGLAQAVLLERLVAARERRTGTGASTGCRGRESSGGRAWGTKRRGAERTADGTAAAESTPMTAAEVAAEGRRAADECRWPRRARAQ